eukprot:m.223760 g.223760  ORF g.223760 m.223760 type:complete len:259 (-) comp10976_c0_seq1:129-905(-)
MKRLFGAAPDSKAPTEEHPGCDKFEILSRCILLLGTAVCSALIASKLHDQATSDQCIFSADFVRGPVPLQYGNTWECKFGYAASLTAAIISGIFFLLGLKNLYHGSVKSHASWASKLYLVVNALILVAFIVCSAIFTARLVFICNQAESAAQYYTGHSHSCRAAMAEIGTTWCEACPVGNHANQYDSAIFARNVLWAVCGLMIVVVALVTIRYLRARRADQLALEERRLKRQQEAEAAAREAEKHKGEGKGFVYRMLL